MRPIYTPEVSPQIEFSFQLTEKDVVAASSAFCFWRRCLRPGIAISSVGVIASVALIYLQPDWLGIEFPTWLGRSFQVIAVGLTLICLGTLVPSLHRRASIRQFQRCPTGQKRMSFQVFDDHILVTSELHDSDLRWQAFLKAKEIPGYLYLFTSPLTGYPIPLAYLTPSQASQLRELVKSHVPAAGRSFSCWG